MSVLRSVRNHTNLAAIFQHDMMTDLLLTEMLISVKKNPLYQAWLNIMICLFCSDTYQIIDLLVSDKFIVSFHVDLH